MSTEGVIHGTIPAVLAVGEYDQDDLCLVSYDDLFDLMTEVQVTRRFVCPENWSVYEAAMRAAGLEPRRSHPPTRSTG